MKRIIVFLIIVFGLLLLTFVAYKYRQNFRSLFQQKETTIHVNSGEPVLAVFSMYTDIESQPINYSFPHFKVRLADNRNWDVSKGMIAAMADSIPIMLTVETWDESRINAYNKNPLEELLNGEYDDLIFRLCTEIIREKPNVFIRINPEMEVPVHAYPWQYQGPVQYINAFRYLADAIKRHCPKVQIVWGPAGYPGAMEYYPGDDVVDAASITIKSNSEQSLHVYPKDYPLHYDIYRRLHRLRFINKPVYVLGSNQCEKDALDVSLVNKITRAFIEERDIVYSCENFLRFDSEKNKKRTSECMIGMYDPQALLIHEKCISVEHLFVDFQSLENGLFEKDFQKVIERGHDVIVTFEPFRLPNGDVDLHVLQNVTAGKYDRVIKRFFSILRQTKRKVYLRYAHEMEIPIARYPWQSRDPVEYIHSFRYFMNFTDTLPNNIKRIWGPAGDRGSIEWYPGNDVVDLLSIAIYGLPDKNITDPKKQESFATIFYRKKWRLRFIDKPIFITEFGVKGPEYFQTQWLENAARVIRENPQVVGVNYFNMSDTPKAWGEIKPPDWSIRQKSLYRFVEVLKGDKE